MPSDTFGQHFRGQFSDGVTAASAAVDVVATATGLEIRRAAPAASLDWPYASLSTAEPISPSAIDVLVSSAMTPGATLFVADGTFARRIGAELPELTTRRTRWRNATPWLVVAVSIAALVGLLHVLDVSPARTMAGLLPQKVRVAVGEQVVRSMVGDRKVCDAPEGRAALEKMSERLAKAAKLDKPFRIVVADWGLVNAFATPGGQIVMTKGLIVSAKTPDEVAGVLAHEMGHGIELHPETGLVRSIGLAAATELVLAGSSGSLSNIGLILAQLGYSRVAEREADERALAILKDADIPPDGLADFFRRIMEKDEDKPEVKGRGALNLLRSHPTTPARIAMIESRARYNGTPSLDSKEWQQLRAICGPVDPAAASEKDKAKGVDPD